MYDLPVVLRCPTGLQKGNHPIPWPKTMTNLLGGSRTRKTSFAAESLEGDKDLVWVHITLPALPVQLWETPWRGRSRDGPCLLEA